MEPRTLKKATRMVNRRSLSSPGGTPVASQRRIFTPSRRRAREGPPARWGVVGLLAESGNSVYFVAFAILNH